MPEPHVISALIERRARVDGELKAAQLRVMRLRGDRAAIDACLRMFKTDYDPATVQPKVTLKKNPADLPKGTGSRRALEILRQSGEALTAPQLATRILIAMSKDTDARAVMMLAKTIHSSFSRQKNPVVRYDRSTYPGKWSLLP
jgi:hypothetical protein